MHVLDLAFRFLGSLEDCVSSAVVNRAWARILGDIVIPRMIQTSCPLLAWYDERSLETAALPCNARVPTCVSWRPHRGCSQLLDAFPFPAVLKKRAALAYRGPVPAPAADDAAAEAASSEQHEKLAVHEWTARPVGYQPRVVRSAAGRQCVQFADAAGRNATYLQTSTLSRPVDQPVTVFLVGIAFDAATFVSGLDSRFELCHDYCNGPGGYDDRAFVSITAHPVADSSDSEDPAFHSVVTGTTQPGEWHVYSAVFNHGMSELFVDGVREGTSTNVGTGRLDGLTLGTDHRNEFALGSMFEGSLPGVIAELALFGTALNQRDRRRIEHHLMRRHGIPVPSPEREEQRKLEKRAHTMLLQRAPGPVHEACPLKYLARHNLVSWAIEHPITGAKVRPKRIGVRETAESSDW